MTARDRYTLPLKCPDCGRAGVTHVSENDGPWIKSAGFRVVQVSGGFAIGKLGATSVDTDFICVACKKVSG